MENLKKVIFEQALMYEQQENETNMLYIQPAEILRTIITQSDLDEEYAEYKKQVNYQTIVLKSLI